MRVRWLICLFVLVSCGAALATRRAPLTSRIDRLVVDKSDRRMEAYSGEERVAVYRIGIGRGGLGDKRWEGDSHTPEGVYRIDRRHVSARFHRFLHISYPNRHDVRRYRESLDEVPRENGRRVGIGGDIGIHGTGGHDWAPVVFRRSAGCIIVDDDEAEELYELVTDDATIVIRR